MATELEQIKEILDSQARVLVGILLRRIEVLEENNSLNPKLYKALIKEHIYEYTRNLKTLIKLQLTVGKVEFK